MMKVQKQNTNSSCSTPSDFRKQSWAELSEDLLTDSEPGAWESERYTDLESSPQTSPMQSPVQSPAMAKNEAMSGAWESERYTDLESSPQTTPMQSPVQSPAMAKNEAMSGGLGNGDFVPQPNYSIAFPVIDIAGLPKALCNNVCVEAMLQQAGLTNGVSGFMTDETSTVRVMLANWPSAMHCMDHFKKSSWAGGSLQITMGLAIPQAAQQVSAAECYPQNSPTGNSQMNYFGASMNSDAFDCAAY